MTTKNLHYDDMHPNQPIETLAEKVGKFLPPRRREAEEVTQVSSDSKIGFQITARQMAVILTLIFTGCLWYLRSESREIIRTMAENQRIVNENMNLRYDALIKNQENTNAELREVRRDIKVILSGRPYNPPSEESIRR